MEGDFGNQILIGVQVVILIWLLVVTFFLAKTIRHYNKLTGGTEEKSLSMILEKILDSLAKAEEEKKELRRILEELKKDGVSHIQKIGLVRFNPFSDTGGDQSFALALLDGENNGLVITGLHSRESTRLYTKPIKGGKSVGYELSKEEEESLRKAVKGKIKE
ncbi:DUF4446 family protein [Candidatus Shapirobacteria bacterium]|nr:DUF4446 family protein [Candidatus Shapirobacteria bacterium]